MSNTNHQERIEHFQWIVDELEERGGGFYLEKYWYDAPTLVSIEVARQEIENTKES